MINQSAAIRRIVSVRSQVGHTKSSAPCALLHLLLFAFFFLNASKLVSLTFGAHFASAEASGPMFTLVFRCFPSLSLLGFCACLRLMFPLVYNR